MRKTVFYILLVLTMLFVGTQSDISARSKIKKKKMLIWCIEFEKEALDGWIKKYKEETGISIKVKIKDYPRTDYIKAFANNKTLPDIIIGANDWVGDYAMNNAILPLKIDGELDGKFDDNIIKMYEYHGQTYGVPYCIDNLVLFYNKDLIDSVPTSWEDLLDVAKKHTDISNGQYGFLYGIKNNFYSNIPFITAQGGYFFKQDGTGYDILDIGLDSEGSLKGGKFILRLVDEGVVPAGTTNSDYAEKFASGNVAIIMDGLWNKHRWESSLNVGVAKLPTLGGSPSRPLVGSRGFLISSKTKYPNEANDFVINYASSYDLQNRLFLASGKIPALIDLREEIIAKDKIVRVAYEGSKEGIPMPNLKAMHLVWYFAAKMVDAVAAGEKTVEESFKEAKKNIKEKISANYNDYN